MMRHACRVFGAVLVLVATGVGDAAPRLAVSTDTKLDSQLRPRVTVPSTSALVPLRMRGSKERVLVRVTSTAGDLQPLRRAGLRIDRVSTKRNLVRGRIRKKDLR